MPLEIGVEVFSAAIAEMESEAIAMAPLGAFLGRPHICGGPFCFRRSGFGGKSFPVLVRTTALSADTEEGDARQQLLGPAGKDLRRGRHFLGRTRILLDHFVELVDRPVDLTGANILLAAGGAAPREAAPGFMFHLYCKMRADRKAEAPYAREPSPSEPDYSL